MTFPFPYQLPPTKANLARQARAMRKFSRHISHGRPKKRYRKTGSTREDIGFAVVSMSALVGLLCLLSLIN